MSGFGAAQVAEAAAGTVLGWAGEPGKTRPMHGGGRTAKRMRRRELGKVVALLVEEFAEGLRGARSMRRAERSQRDVQLGVGDANVARGGDPLSVPAPPSHPAHSRSSARVPARQ